MKHAKDMTDTELLDSADFHQDASADVDMSSPGGIELRMAHQAARSAYEDLLGIRNKNCEGFRKRIRAIDAALSVIEAVQS